MPSLNARLHTGIAGLYFHRDWLVISNNFLDPSEFLGISELLLLNCNTLNIPYSANLRKAGTAFNVQGNNQIQITLANLLSDHNIKIYKECTQIIHNLYCSITDR